MFERIDRAVHSGTKRVHGLTGLLMALFGLSAAAILLWSIVTGFVQRQVMLQLPLGPQLVISDLSGSSESEGQEEEASSVELKPISIEYMQQMVPLFPPLQMAGAMCVFGEFGAVKIYQSGRRRRGKP